MTKNRIRFAEWLALPETLRHPETLDELAALMNVRPATLSRWEKENVGGNCGEREWVGENCGERGVGKLKYWALGIVGSG